MRRNLIGFISISLFLVGCSPQNLAPLEKKTTQLRDDNHQLKLDIQEINKTITAEKNKLRQLEEDKKNIKKKKQNEEKAQKLQAASDYYKAIAREIDDYHHIDEDVMKNKHDAKVIEALNQFKENVSDAYKTYTSDVSEKDLKTENEKQSYAQVKKLNKQIQAAFNTIADGYNKKNMKTIKEGRSKLTSISLDA